MKNVLKVLLSICLLCVSIISYGQAADQPCDGDDPFDCPEIPIDGGASLLLLAGAGAGVYRIAKKRMSNNNV